MRICLLLPITLLAACCKRPAPLDTVPATSAHASASAAPSESPVPYREHGATCVPIVTQDNDCAVSVQPGTTNEQIATLGRWLVAKRPKGSWRIFDDDAHIDAVSGYLRAPAKGKLTKEQDAWAEAHYVAWAYRGFSPTQKRDVGKVEFRRDNPVTQKRTPTIEF